MKHIKLLLQQSGHSEDRSMERGQWYWVNKAVILQYAPKIGFAGIAVYDCLAVMANAQQTCYPSQGYIANVLGCSRSTVNRTMKVLVQHGLVRIEKTARYPQVYHLRKVSGRMDARRVSHGCTPPVSPMHTNKNYNKKY